MDQRKLGLLAPEPFSQGLKALDFYMLRPARLKEAAEKVVAMEETADSSGLKPLGMTKIKGLQWRT